MNATTTMDGGEPLEAVIQERPTAAAGAGPVTNIDASPATPRGWMPTGGKGFKTRPNAVWADDHQP